MWAQITHRWADGTEIELEVGSDEAAYPDVVSELVARVIDLYRATCTETCTETCTDEAGE
jgi:hypothetical protein